MAKAAADDIVITETSRRKPDFGFCPYQPVMSFVMFLVFTREIFDVGVRQWGTALRKAGKHPDGNAFRSAVPRWLGEGPDRWL